MTEPQTDMGAYELIMDGPINIFNIIDKWERGEGKFWMVCVESGGGVMRFRGVFAPGDCLPWVRVFIDWVPPEAGTAWNTVYVNAPSGQHMSKLEIAMEVQKELGGTLYKDGKKVTKK